MSSHNEEHPNETDKSMSPSKVDSLNDIRNTGLGNFLYLPPEIREQGWLAMLQCNPLYVATVKPCSRSSSASACWRSNMSTLCFHGWQDEDTCDFITYWDGPVCKQLKHGFDYIPITPSPELQHTLCRISKTIALEFRQYFFHVHDICFEDADDFRIFLDMLTPVQTLMVLHISISLFQCRLLKVTRERHRHICAKTGCGNDALWLSLFRGSLPPNLATITFCVGDGRYDNPRQAIETFDQLIKYAKRTVPFASLVLEPDPLKKSKEMQKEMIYNLKGWSLHKRLQPLPPKILWTEIHKKNSGFKKRMGGFLAVLRAANGASNGFSEEYRTSIRVARIDKVSNEKEKEESVMSQFGPKLTVEAIERSIQEWLEEMFAAESNLLASPESILRCRKSCGGGPLFARDKAQRKLFGSSMTYGIANLRRLIEE